MPSSAAPPQAIYPLPLHDALPIYGVFDENTSQRPFGDQLCHEFIVFRLQLSSRSEEHTSELQSLRHLVCRLLLPRPRRSTLFPSTTLFRSTESSTRTPASARSATNCATSSSSSDCS